MSLLTQVGPLIYGDDLVKPQYEKSYGFSDTVRRPRPTPLMTNPTSMQRSSRTLYRDLAETHPWFGSHDGATWSVVEHGQYYPMLSIPQSRINAINVQLRNKIKAQNLNLAMSIAEFREVGPMFLKLSREIIRGYKFVKRDLPWEALKAIIGKPNKRTPFHKAVSGRWLEFSFGIAPLMSDVLALGDEAARKATDGAIQRLSASWQDRDIQEWTERTGPVGGALKQYYYADVFVSRQVSHRRTAYYKVSSEGLKRAAALGFTNPASIAWELVPLSFVVDWAIPVGGWLSSMDALTGVQVQTVVSGSEFKYDGSTTTRGGKKVGTSTLSVVNKSRGTGGSLGIGLPSYSPSTSLQAIASGVSLLSQFRKGF